MLANNSLSQSIGELLAEYLESHKAAMEVEWLDRVRRDMPVETQSLTTEALLNHLPHLFEDIIRALRYYRNETVRELLHKDAGDHTIKRLQQGYDLPSLLHEVSHLRAVFIYHLRVFEEQHSDQGMVARLFITNTVHRLLDELAVDSAEQFLKSRK